MTDKIHIKKDKKKILSLLLTILLSFLLLLVVLIVIILPAFISSQTGNRLILDQIDTAVDGTAQFDQLSMGWRSGIHITNLHFETTGKEISVKADSFSTVPEYLPILRGHIAISKTRLVKPEIFLDLTEHPEAVAEEISVPVESEKTVAIPQIPIQTVNIEIVDGKVTVSQAGTLLTRAENINIEIQVNPGGEKSFLNFSTDIATGADPAVIQASGFIIPQGSGIKRDFEKASGEFSINLNRINLSAVEPFLTASGINAVMAGTIDGDIQAAIQNGMLDTVKGGFTSADLKLGGELLNGDIFSSKKLTIDADIFSDNTLLNITTLDITGDYFSVKAEGKMPTTLDSLDAFLNSQETRLLAVLTCNIAALAGQLKNTIGLKDQAALRSGQLNARIEKASGSSPSPLHAQAVLSGLSGTVDQKQISLVKPLEIAARISPSEKGIRFEQVTIKSDFADISGSGTESLFNYRAEVDLLKMHNQIGSLLYSPDYSLSGRLLSEGRAVIEDKILLEGSASIDNLRFTIGRKRADTPSLKTTHNLTLDTLGGSAFIDTLTLDANFGSLSIKNGVLPFEAPETGRLNLPVSINMDAAPLKPWIDLFADLPEGLKFDGTFLSDINLVSEDGLFLVNTDNTQIKNLKLKLPDTNPLTESLINIKLNAKTDTDLTAYQAKWNIESTVLKTDGSIKGKSSGNNESIEGSLNLDYDWQKLSKFAQPFLPDGLVISGTRNDAYRFSSAYSSDTEGSMLANLSASGRAGFDTASYMGLNAGKTEINFNMSKGKLELPVFETPVNNGKLRFGCSADFNQNPVILKLPGPMDIISDVELNDIIANQLLQYVNPVFANVAGVDGKADLSCRKLAFPLDMEHFDQAVLDATLSVENMKIQSSGLLNTILSAASIKTERQIMNIRPTNFMLEKGYVSYDNMQIEVDRLPINFSGRIGVMSESLAMSLVLPYTLSGSTVKVGDEVEMKDRITVPLKGTLGKPKIDITGALKKGILEEGIQRGLDRLFR